MFFLHILILYHLLEEVIFTLYYLYTTTTHLKTAEYETEADTFAIELLLPDDTFSEYLSAGYTSEQISRITGYAQRLIDLKASHIKIL